MNIKKNKNKKNFILNKFIPFTLIIILLFLTILSFLPKPILISQRKLQSVEPAQGNNTTADNITDDNPKEKSDFGKELTGMFVIFLFMAIYILVRLSCFPENIQKRKNDLYVFIYFANNGTLIASGINILNIFDPNSGILDQILNYGPVYGTSLIYVIGGICFIVNLVKNECIPEQFFSCEYLGYIAKFPCFVWELIPLADYCCMCTTITIYHYEDGHKESDACCVCLWNLFIKFLKFISYVYSVISFYIFYVVFIIGWLIAKLIYQIVLSCRKNENNISQNEINEPDIQTDPRQVGIQNISNQHPIQYIDDPRIQSGGMIIINNIINTNQNSPNENTVHNSQILTINQRPQNINHISPNEKINQNSQPLDTNPITPNENINQNSRPLNAYQNNLNAFINQNNQTLNTNNNSQNEICNNHDNPSQYDLPSEEEINNQPNSNTDRELNQSRLSHGNPAPVLIYNENPNLINKSHANSDKPNDKEDDKEYDKEYDEEDDKEYDKENDNEDDKKYDKENDEEYDKEYDEEDDKEYDKENDNEDD